VKIASSPLFEKTTKSFPVFIFYLFLSVVLIAIDVRLQVLDILRDNVKGFFLPIMISSQNIIGSAKKWFLPHLQIEQIHSLYQESIKEKYILQKRIEQLQELQFENQKLRQINQLNLKKENELVIAEIIDYQPIDRKILINKGRNDGINISQPIINEKGLIGQIVNVYNNYSEAYLITSINIKVPIVIKNPTRKDLFATLVGTGADLVELHHIPQDYSIKLGDELYTSGLAKTYVNGLLVATVSNIEAVPDLLGTRILAKPIVNPNEIDFVAVITDNSEFGQWLQEIMQKE